MKKVLLLFAIALFAGFTFVKEVDNDIEIPKTEAVADSSRIEELNAYWNNLAKTVAEGDFEGYKEGYHKDAVIVFASGKNKTSLPLEKALAGWKKGFTDTQSGKNRSHVEFRFSQRIGDDTTAHETGIFIYTTSDSNGENEIQYPTHFEMLLVKRNDKWLGVMEYQKSTATLQEWNALKK
jgi:hypothetical protein